MGLLGFALLISPLLFFLHRPDIFIPLLVGYLSHFMIDCVNTTGAGIAWPSERRMVFPYVEKEPEKFRIVTGSFPEMILLGVLVLFLCAFYGDIRYFLDPTKEQYLYGSLKAEGRPALMSKYRCFNPIFDRYGFVVLNIATWKDVEEAKIAGTYITNGKMTIKTLLKEGETLEEIDQAKVAIEKGGYQKTMAISFYVRALDDVLIKEGDEIKTGQVLARDQTEVDQARSKGRDLADLREQRRRTKSLADMSLKEISLGIQREENALAEVKEIEAEAKQLYEAGVIGVNEYRGLKEKRCTIEYRIEDLKARWEKEKESNQIQLLSLDKQIRNLKEEVGQRQAGGKIRSKVDGLITAMNFSNSEEKVKVTLAVLTKGLRGGEDGGI